MEFKKLKLNYKQNNIIHSQIYKKSILFILKLFYILFIDLLENGKNIL